MGYREFRSLEEIRSLHRDLDKMEFVGRIFDSLPSFSYSDGLLWENALLRAFAHDQMKSSSQEMSTILGATVSWLNNLRQEKVRVEDSFKNWLLQIIGIRAEPETILLSEITRSALKEIAPE